LLRRVSASPRVANVSKLRERVVGTPEDGPP
jgi:hypothetical protein